MYLGVVGHYLRIIHHKCALGYFKDVCMRCSLIDAKDLSY